MEHLEEVIWYYVQDYAAIILLVLGGAFTAFKIVVVPCLESKRKDRK